MSNTPRSLNSTIIAAQQQLLELEARRLATPEPTPMPRRPRWRRLAVLAAAPVAAVALVVGAASALQLAGTASGTSDLTHQVPAVQLGVDRLEASTMDAALQPVGQVDAPTEADEPAATTPRTSSRRDRNRDRDRDREETSSSSSDTDLGGRSLGGGILGDTGSSTSGSGHSFGDLETVDVFGAGGELRR